MQERGQEVGAALVADREAPVGQQPGQGPLDQFLQDIPAVEISRQHQVDADYGDYWSGTAPLDTGGPPGSAWGIPGRYVYRYIVQHGDGLVADWVIDPFAREFGIGKQSAITVDYQPYTWSDAETTWKTPKLQDLIIFDHLRSQPQWHTVFDRQGVVVLERVGS